MRVLVLSGGGAKGCWQAGAIKALMERYDYDAFVGTSVGSVNAAGLAYYSAEEVVRLWKGLKSKDIVKPPSGLRFLWSSGFYDLAPLGRYLDNWIPDMLPPKKNAYAVYMDLRDYALHYRASYHPKDDYIRGILASSSISGFHKPIDKYFVDGGHREQVPVNFAKTKLGATHVTAVLTEPHTQFVKADYEPSFPKIANNFLRGIGAMSKEIMWNDVRDADEIVAPAKDVPIGIMEFNGKKMSPIIDAAYEEVKLKLVEGENR